MIRGLKNLFELSKNSRNRVFELSIVYCIFSYVALKRTLFSFKNTFYVVEHKRAIADTLFTLTLYFTVVLLSRFVALVSPFKQFLEYRNNSFFMIFSIWTVLKERY